MWQQVKKVVGGYKMPKAPLSPRDQVQVLYEKKEARLRSAYPGPNADAMIRDAYQSFEDDLQEEFIEACLATSGFDAPPFTLVDVFEYLYEQRASELRVIVRESIGKEEPTGIGFHVMLAVMDVCRALHELDDAIIGTIAIPAVKMATEEHRSNAMETRVALWKILARLTIAGRSAPSPIPMKVQVIIREQVSKVREIENAARDATANILALTVSGGAGDDGPMSVKRTLDNLSRTVRIIREGVDSEEWAEVGAAEKGD